MYLHNNPKASARSEKEHYKVYGTFNEEEVTKEIGCARLGLVASSYDLKAGCEIDMSLIEAGSKITLLGDCKSINICVCSPLIISYCLKKKHISTSLFVSTYPIS